MGERKETSQPVLVEVTGPKGHQPLWTVEPLIEDLLDEGLDARLAHEEFPGGGAGEWETVILWVADSAGHLAFEAAVLYAIKHLKRMFRKHPEVPRHRTVEIRSCRGDQSTVYERIEMGPGYQEPVRQATPEAFEEWTSGKPPEPGIKRFEEWGPDMTVTGFPPEELVNSYKTLVDVARRISYENGTEDEVRDHTLSWTSEGCEGSQSLAKATASVLRYEITSKIENEAWNKAGSRQEASEIKELIEDLDRGLERIEEWL